MIKAEIQVGTNQYILDFPEEANLEFVYNYALSVARGQEIHKRPDYWLHLNKGEFDHIRIYYEESELSSIVLPPNEEERVEENPTIKTKRMEVLGQVIHLTVAMYADGYTIYLLPYLINNQPALTMLRREAIQSVSEEYAKHEGFQPFEVVLPHGNIYDSQEALAFVVDYAEEAAEEREIMLKDTDKTARGFTWPEEK